MVEGTTYPILQMNKRKLFQLQVIYQEHQVSPWQTQGSNLDFHDSKKHTYSPRSPRPMDLLSGYQAICTLSHLGANTGKRVRHLEPMKFRDCTEGKYQSSGNQRRKKKKKKKKPRQCWGGHTTTKVCNEKKQGDYCNHRGNSLSISPVILDPHLLHCTPHTGGKKPKKPCGQVQVFLRHFEMILLYVCYD